MNEARDAAWRAYYEAQCANWTPRDEVIAKNAFVAGWAGRKAAQYVEVVKVLTPEAAK